MKHFSRCLRAISPVLAVLMMIAVAIAGALVTYAWVMGYIGVTTERADESIMIPSVANDPVDVDLLVYVQNVGEGTVQFDEGECLYVDGLLVSCSISGVAVSDGIATLEKGGTVVLCYSGGAVFPGVRVKVKVTTLRGTSTETYAYPAGTMYPVPEPAFDHFEFSLINGSQVSGVPFTVTIRAIDENGYLFTSYSGVNVLVHSDLVITPSVTGNFLDGVWTGNVTLFGSATSTTLSTFAQSNDSWTGISNIFDVTISVEEPLFWSQIYGGANREYAYSVVATSDGGYVLVGSTESFGAGGFDLWFVKTNATGYMEWNRTYGGPDDDVAYSVIETGDGGYAIVGSRSGVLWLVKTNATGYMEWNHTYAGLGSIVVGSIDGLRCSLVNASDGGYVIAGGRWLFKTDEFGNAEQNRTYNRIINSLIITSDGGYALAGTTSSGGNDEGDFWLIKLDEFLNMEWENTYDGTSQDVAFSLVEAPYGGYALAGITRIIVDNESDVWLVKTDEFGNEEWNQTYGTERRDRAYSLVVTPDDGYAIAGFTDVGPMNDVLLIKTDESGNMEWNRTYGGLGGGWEDVAYSLIVIPDGYVLAGYATETFGHQSDFFLIKDIREP